MIYLFFRKISELLIFITFVCPSFSSAQNISLEGNKPVKAKIISDFTSLQPKEIETNSIARIGVLFTIEPGWHIYWVNSGQSALPTAVNWNLPQGWKASDLRWPAPIKFQERADIITYGYTNETLLIADIFAPPVIPNEKEVITITADIRWLVCKDRCLPGNTSLKKDFLFSTSEPLEPSADRKFFEKYDALTPKPLADLNKLKKFEATAIKIFPSQDQIIISVTDFPAEKNNNLCGKIQIFPFANSNISLDTAAKLLSTEDKTKFNILLPFKLKENSKLENSTVAGILTFSTDVTNTDEDFSVVWSTPLNTINQEHPLIQLSSIGQSLTYRFKINNKNFSPINKSNLLVALISAFIAGIILNLMPCVLPIISIKVMSFVGYSGRPQKEVIKSALAFSLGILTTFIILALIVIALQDTGYLLGWGFQFQYPAFVFSLLVIIFTLSLSFFEVYSFSLPGIQSATNTISKLHMPLVKHFFDGVLATALSTPCTAPFLGTALAFAFTSPPGLIIATFLSIGCGLAFPYLILSSNQKFLALLPKPGPWMYTFKKIMGFSLLVTVLWLLYVLNRQTEKGVIGSLAILLLIFLCIIFRKSLIRVFNTSFQHFLFNSLVILFLLFITSKLWPSITTLRSQVPIKASTKIAWQPYSEDAISKAHQLKQNVFIDFTAAWCITCYSNELAVIETDTIAKAIKDNNILPLKADWTSGDKLITDALNKYGGQGVPHYIVIPWKSKEPIVLDTLLTQNSLINAFKN